MKHLSNTLIITLLALVSQAVFGQLMDMRSITICVADYVKDAWSYARPQTAAAGKSCIVNPKS